MSNEMRPVSGPAVAGSSDPRGRTFLALDGLRGVAAIVVVLCHFASRTDLNDLFAHGYLAVDFFFALSGFVLVHAYRGRLGRGEMGLWPLLGQRAVRFLPLVVLGLLLALVIETQRPDVTDPGQHLRDMVAAFFMGSLLLPIWWTTTLEMLLFPLNLPIWSLFFEAVVNIVAGVMAVRRASLLLVAALVAVSGLGLIWGALTEHTLDLGYSARTFWYGFARVFFSFFVGVLLYLSGASVRRVPPILSLALFILLLAVPRLEGVNNGLFDLIVVLFVFPFIIVHMASCEPPAALGRLCRLSGALSYPMYTLHYPLVRAMGVVIRDLNLSLLAQLVVVLLGTMAIIALAWMADRFYDAPLRARLTRRRPTRRPAGRMLRE